MNSLTLQMRLDKSLFCDLSKKNCLKFPLNFPSLKKLIRNWIVIITRNSHLIKLSLNYIRSHKNCLRELGQINRYWWNPDQLITLIHLSDQLNLLQDGQCKHKLKFIKIIDIKEFFLKQANTGPPPPQEMETFLPKNGSST